MSGLDGLQRLSLILVLVGLTTIYASSTVLSPEKVSISDISESELGESVRVVGAVRDLSTTDETVFFDLEGEKAAIRAVYFGSGLDIEEGGTYTFEGRLDIYQGEMELIVDRAVSTSSGAD